MVLSAFAAVLAAMTWGTWGDLGRDTGYDLVAGARLARGELPYVDFVYYYGPLAPGLLALTFTLAGVGIGPAVTLGLALAVGGILMTYALARFVVGRLAAFLAAAITAPVVFNPNHFNFVQPHTYSAPIAVCVTLGFLLGIASYAATGHRRWLWAAGTCAGLVTLTRPEFLAGTFAAAGVWLALRARAGLGGWREAAIVATPAALIPAVVYGALLTLVTPQRLFLENLYPVAALRAAGNVVLRGNAPFTLESFAELGWKTLLYGAGTVTMLLAARVMGGPGRLRRPAVLGAVAFGLLIVVASTQKPETLRWALKFVYGWIPAGAATGALLLLWRFQRRAGHWSASAQVQLAGTIVLSVLALKIYAAFLLYSHVPQIAAYTAPLVAVFLARLHLVELARGAPAYRLGTVWLASLALAGAFLAWVDGRAESAPVRGPGGAVFVRPGEAVVHRAAMSWILSRTAPGEPILIAPQLTTLYTLSGRRNPLPHLSLLPGALPTESDERAAIARLEAADVRLVITDRHVYSIYGHSSFGESFQRTLAAWIREEFTHVAILRGEGPRSRVLDVWLRDGSVPRLSASR
jgi:hypothetical protein